MILAAWAVAQRPPVFPQHPPADPAVVERKRTSDPCLTDVRTTHESTLAIETSSDLIGAAPPHGFGRVESRGQFGHAVRRRFLEKPVPL